MTGIEGVGPLHAATLTRDEEITRILLDKGAPVNAYNKTGITPLHTAVYSGEAAVVRLLIERGADVNAKVRADAGRGETAVHMAVASWREELLPLLLKSGAEVDTKGEFPKGQTPLLVAASWGNEEALETLLDWGADIFGRYADGRTALHVAAAGRFQMVELLLQKGLDLCAEDSTGDTPLCIAAMHGKYKTAEILVREGLKVMSPAQKARALASAAAAGKLDVTSYMMSHDFGAVLDNRGAEGALLLAAKFGQEKVLIDFLRRGVATNMQNVHYVLAISLAAAGGHSNIVRILKDAEQSRQYVPVASSSAQSSDFYINPDEIVSTIAMDIALSANRKVVANPTPGGLAASCSVCQGLDFRRGVRSNVGVIQFVKSTSLTWSVANGCSGCSMLRQCLDQLLLVYGNSLEKFFRRTEQTFILSSMVKGGPLLVSWGAGAGTFSTCMELYCKPGSATIWPVIGTSREVLGAEGKQNLALKFLGECTAHHVHCSNKTSHLPTRVIEVGGPDKQPRLYITKGENARYVALSHCWGGGSPITTTTETLDQRCKAMPLEELPKTFADAVNITRSLDVQYLWIDSLCILQGNAEDWEREAARMNEVYANCYVMIAADGSDNCHGGCFKPGNTDPTTSFSVECPGPGGRSSRIYSRLTNMRDKNQDEVCHRLHDPRGGYIRSPLNDRGWTLQERLLAPRILHFGTAELGWECTENIACECQILPTEADREFNFKARLLNMLEPDLTAEASDSSRAKEQWLWANVIEEFSHRTLTQHTDTLYALMSSTAADEYICGMWKKNIMGYLRWEPDYSYIKTGKVALGTRFRSLEQPRRHKAYYAPSWSWASIISPIKFEGAPPFLGPDEKVQFKLNKGETHWPDPQAYNFSVSAIDVVPNKGNPFGPPCYASLTLHGFVASAILQGGVKKLPGRSTDYGGTLVPRVSSTGDMLTQLNAEFVPDVPDELLTLAGEDELLLFFMKESIAPKEEESSAPAGHYRPLNPHRTSAGLGMVLRPAAGTATGAGQRYSRAGTFYYHGDGQVQGWKGIRMTKTVTVV
ncbi:hypothetical protein BDV95DRAFT_497373 [Massariosphaeria phaeospora]|uniref:Heterokaryon incompatibility domain-containing protein n=1 Tax=Massariosphaeria phaeospora TaxID=100035 RepID=A0A7C8M7P3_9PLEO|nr:hypothetical protein BDV95DRAFT_497373 [Massariosphaeria phaeospora]